MEKKIRQNLQQFNLDNNKQYKIIKDKIIDVLSKKSLAVSDSTKNWQLEAVGFIEKFKKISKVKSLIKKCMTETSE